MTHHVIALADPFRCAHREARKFPGGGRFSHVIFCPYCRGIEKLLRRRHRRDSKAFDYECTECGGLYYVHILGEPSYCGFGCPWWYIRAMYHFPDEDWGDYALALDEKE